jgi:hypothetical protein
MEKNEETFKQTFNVDFGENHDEITLSSKKSKICKIAALIIAGIAIITTTILLVAHFKYGLFGSKISEAIEINREANSLEFFSETRNLKTKMTYASGQTASTEQEIDTDFVVLLKEKKEIKEKSTFYNNGYIVVLGSKTKSNGEEAQLDSFNIFDEKIIKEFESNPNGSKYPIAQFSFYEDGTLIKIDLPKDIDSYNAEKLISLIKDVIPKLSINKEDEENGIEIKTKTKNKNGKKQKTFSKYDPPKEFYDKYSKSTFKGSKISKLVETDVEDDKISEIRSNTNLYLETEKDGEEENGFGIDDLFVNVDSKIVSTKTEKEKVDDIKLVDRIVTKLTFVDSEEVLSSFHKTNDIEIEEPEVPMRNLATTTWQWALFENKSFLGTKASAYYVIDLKNNKVVNKIKIKAGSFTVSVGNEDGLSQSKTDSNKDTRGSVLLGTFPIAAYEIRIDIKLSMGLNAGVTVSTKQLKITLSGSVNLKAELVVGTLIKFTAGVKGKIIGASFTCAFNKSPLSFSKSGSKINISSGTITGYLTGEIKGTGKKLVNQELEIWKGWLNKDIPL